MVHALYIDPRGPYPKLLGPDRCWDAERDARTFAGPGPIVAHPPCGPWGAIAHWCTKQDRSLAPIAVDQVRRFGGVLEHPKGSRLWGALGLPMPDAPRDRFGGFTIEIDQVRWGHVARKSTWLYIVTASPVPLRFLDELPPPRAATHWICGNRHRPHGDRAGGKRPAHIKVCGAELRRRTPIEFAKWLVSIAERSRGD